MRVAGREAFPVRAARGHGGEQGLDPVAQQAVGEDAELSLGAAGPQGSDEQQDTHGYDRYP
jgi:hypothetical protein